jgi:hypothetical protein
MHQIGNDVKRIWNEQKQETDSKSGKINRQIA